MGRLLVTVGSDGVTDWVKTPDGLRYNLGRVSVLSFVSSLTRDAKNVMKAFLKDGSAMASVDEERMWALLMPPRPRFAADVSSSMGTVSVYSREFTADALQNPRTEKMTTISDDLTAIERHIQALNEAAANNATNLSEGVRELVKMAGKIKSPNQSKNQTYYNLGAPKVFEVGDKVAALSYDVYAANSDLATDITAKAEATVQVIDKLAKAGRKFNASRARADVREVTAKVAGIVKTDLTASWVRGDLTKLAARMDQIHGLFVPKR